MGEALAGFSDPNIVLLGALFVIGEGLVRTGVPQRIGDWLMRTAGTSETRLIALLMTVVATLGAFMSSTGVVAILIPVALRIAQTTGAAPRQLMMPISMAALISGMLSLVATAPNLVVNSELVRSGSEGFSFFTFTPFGVLVLILGIVYMLFARRWLASDTPGDASGAPSVKLLDWIERYKLADREFRIRLTPESSLVGKALDEIGLREDSGINVVAVERRGRFAKDVFAPTGKTRLRAEDVLLVDVYAPKVDIDEACPRLALEKLPLTGAYFSDRPQEIGMVEVMVGADSRLLGKTLIEARFRTQYRLNVVGLRHGQTAVEQGALNERLRIGDTLLLIGPWKEISRLQSLGSDLVVMKPARGACQRASGSGEGVSGALLPAGDGRAHGHRHRAQCAGRPHRLPPAGRAALHRPGQRLSRDPLEDADPDRRHAALLDRAAEDWVPS